VGRPRPQAIPVSKDSLTINNTPVNHEQEFIPEDELLAGSFFLPSALSKSLRIIFLCISAFAAFLLITQTASFLANIRQLSLLEKIILSAPLAAFGCVIIWIVVKLIILASRLRVSPKIKIKALEELEKRRNLRTLSLKKNRQAVEELASYLQHDFSIRQEMLSSWGIKELVITNLEKSRQELIQTASKPTGTSRDWIVDFEHNIQDKLDEIAQKRIFKYSTNAAVMAGISPFPLIDRLIVLSSSLGMLKELLELYEGLDGQGLKVPVEVVVQNIKDILTVDRWIPCSERLPKEEGMYLITSNLFGSLEAQYVFYSENVQMFVCNGTPVAWMPLPSPYVDKVEICGVTGNECTKCNPGPCQSRKVEKNE
jgi:uncharacterized membrane protein YcjF (UPF0283 family)